MRFRLELKFELALEFGAAEKRMASIATSERVASYEFAAIGYRPSQSKLEIAVAYYRQPGERISISILLPSKVIGSDRIRNEHDDGREAQLLPIRTLKQPWQPWHTGGPAGWMQPTGTASSTPSVWLTSRGLAGDI